jgi:hypothetical protein
VNGGARRLLELFAGAHFTAIAYGRAAAEELAVMPWPSAGAGLRKIAVDAGEHPNADVVLADIADSFARTYGVTDSTVLLIRPDGYLAAIATRDMGRTVSAQAAVMSPVVDIPAVPSF